MRSHASGRAFLHVTSSVILTILAAGLGHVYASHLDGGAERIAQPSFEEEG